ncbi:DUF736 domain-containing protein [Marinivivus vitaminiproducens]|uniref:DUF736 domain-containing protein n=1 Tax=Marinivivus vitaminiproducens TaxID=3035935 RepID=UPI0027983AC6|nr:DUF736 domain-containing protein [Geminicoccaceae bacterium SCSIO 64248]
MAVTLGTFQQFDDGILAGKLATLSFSVAVTVQPVERVKEKAPDYRVYTGRNIEIGAGWSQVAKSSGNRFISVKIGAPEFGERWLYARMVQLETPTEDGDTHVLLWEPRNGN